MSRPKKCRRISFEPDVDYFKPKGVPLVNLDEVELTIDEIEALRLNDYNGINHEEAAQIMKISRQTFGRIIEKARKKIADAIINGKAIKIKKGGNIIMDIRKFQCRKCEIVWEVPFGEDHPSNCPNCKCTDIHRKHEGRVKGGNFVV